ncbi:MAG: hypothetical protein ACO331_12050 [Prochlorothrix sp.]
MAKLSTKALRGVNNTKVLFIESAAQQSHFPVGCSIMNTTPVCRSAPSIPPPTLLPT